MCGRKKGASRQRSDARKVETTGSIFILEKNILYVQYTNPANYPPLEQSGLMLLNAGWDVRYFGVQSEGESSKLVFPEPLAGCQTLWQYKPPGISQKLHFGAFTFMALWRALWQRPAWVY